MFHTYVLRSLKNQKRYIGHTSKKVFQRLHEHNSGGNAWTRANGPFVIIYSEECPTKSDAIKRELFLKSGQGKKWLDEHIPV